MTAVRRLGGAFGMGLAIVVACASLPASAQRLAGGAQRLEQGLRGLGLTAARTGNLAAQLGQTASPVHRVERTCLRRMHAGLETCATASPVHDPLGRILFTGDLATDLALHASKGNIRGQIAKYRHFARMVAEGGLRPQRVFTTQGEDNLALRWFTGRTDEGLPEVVLEISTPSGKITPLFRQVLQDVGARIEDQPPPGLAQMKQFKCNCKKNPRASYRRGMKLSGILMKNEGLDPDAPQLSLLRYTLARYLNNGTTPETLSWLHSNWNGTAAELLEAGFVSQRWKSKIEGMLANPVTNRQVVTHMRARAEQFRWSLDYIRGINPDDHPISFYAAGSLTKGRFSAASDLDIVIHTPDLELQERIVHGPYGFIGGNPETYSILDIGRWFFGNPEFLSHSIDEVGRPGFLEEFFIANARTEWGVQLDLETGALNLKNAPDHFVREESIQMDVVFEAARRYTELGQGIEFVADYFEAVARLPEARVIPAHRLAALGEKLLVDLGRHAEQPELLETLIEQQEVTDELERLMLDFAVRERSLRPAAPPP